MRQILFVLLGVLAIAAAEDQPLQPIDRPVIAGETRCLPFFVATTFGGDAAPHIVFAYRLPDGSTKGASVPKARALVQVFESQTPTYEKTSVEGRDGAIFRLNQAEYEKARACLPPPEQQVTQ